ncbi:hypothetical protein [Methylibium sp.]|uniref:hypothetical protein n=1 Tax=Methylibium sp. TaxID=2067992 RepID=UPI003D148421
MVKFFRSGLALYLLILIIGFGALYFSYKFYNPFPWHDDFIEYHKMYLRPFDPAAAMAPFTFRRLSALFTHAIYAIGIYYPADIVFHEPGYTQRMFFAALFSNFLCLTGAAWLAGKAVKIITGTRGLVYPLIAGTLCFLSYYTQFAVLTGYTEGMTWFLVAAAFVAYLGRRVGVLAIILVLSIVQRESVSVAFAVISAAGMVFDRTQRPFNYKVLLISIACFAGYFVMRKFSGISGYENQTSPAALLAALLAFPIDKQIIFNGFFAQNVIILYFIVSVAVFKLVPEHRFWMPALTVTFLVIFVLGILAGIGGNVGRICAILTPIFAAFSAVSLMKLEQALDAANRAPTGSTPAV